MLLTQCFCTTKAFTSSRTEYQRARGKQHASYTGEVSTICTHRSDLSLGLFEHGLSNKASLDFASRRLGHDVSEEDLLIVRICYTALKALSRTYLFRQLEFGDAIGHPGLQVTS